MDDMQRFFEVGRELRLDTDIPSLQKPPSSLLPSLKKYLDGGGKKPKVTSSTESTASTGTSSNYSSYFDRSTEKKSE
eukprot:Pgem_evm1s14226